MQIRSRLTWWRAKAAQLATGGMWKLISPVPLAAAGINKPTAVSVLNQPARVTVHVTQPVLEFRCAFCRTTEPKLSRI